MRGCNTAYDSAVTTNCEKSAEAIIAIREMAKGRTDESSSKEEKLRHGEKDTMEVGLFMCREKEIDERRELERTQYGAMQEDALAS